MTDPLVGTTVAHYEVLGKLGGGGMGVVYTARNVRLGQIVALKFLPPQWSHDESAKQRFLREAQAASATNHRNICTIHDIETASDGQLFIVMAYYQGETLKQKLEAGPLPVEEAVEIAAQVAEGLAKAHSEGIVHRDVKPGNLMLVEGDVKILDFGLAKFANSLQLTIEGSTLGTVAYMSPEQTRGEEADARSDVWSLGVVLYEMLAGTLPFKGAYPEAVSHAIRHDPVPPIRAKSAELPSQLLTILERALQKDPAARYPNARELARELRQLQGRTIPIDLITAPIHAPALQLPPRRRWWRSPTTAAAAALLVFGGIGAAIWLFTPVERVPVVVAPIVNQTGYAELDKYRLALTQELISDLAETSAVRVVPFDRVLEIVRRFRGSGRDISSRETLQALTSETGARMVVAPTLVYENGAWRGHVEIRDAPSGIPVGVRDTTPVVSSLIKQAAYGLIPRIAAEVDAQTIQAGPRRASLAATLVRLVGRAPMTPDLRMGSLDAALSFSEGIEAYAALEYDAALRAFTAAAGQDPRNPLLLAWRGRTAAVMRHDADAADATSQALRLVNDQSGTALKLFVEAVRAEAQRNVDTALARYTSLVDRHPDDVAAIIELAAFNDRQLRNDAAIAGYFRALAVDSHLVRPHIELCRLYNRSTEAAKALDHARQAANAYRAAGDGAGEAQALLCMTDTFRVGSKSQREDAGKNAAAALGTFEALNMPYNTARAQHYAAMAAEAQGHLADAAAAWELSLASARKVGNFPLQTAVLTNLGTTYKVLGARARAVAFYEDSYKLNEALGNDQGAAYSQATAGALLIEHGDPEAGLRDVQNALTVVRKTGDKNFEVYCLEVIGNYYRIRGRVADAEREVNRALAIARERNRDIGEPLIVLGRIHFDVADYGRAADLFAQVAATGSTHDTTEALLRLSRTWSRIGDFTAAKAELAKARTQMDQLGVPGVAPLFHLAAGELAYESGRVDEAETEFRQSAALWTDAFPDEASIEARIYLGLIDGARGAQARGRAALVTALDQTRNTHRLALESRARINIARLDIRQSAYADAFTMLKEVPADGEQVLGPETQAQVHYWRSIAYKGLGRATDAAAEIAEARKLVERARAALPERFRGGFAARPDIGLSVE